MENPFSGPLASASDDIFAAVCNEPFELGVPAPTVSWNAGAADRLVIFPRWADSVLSARRIVYDAEGRASIEETPVYSTRCGPEDCIAASLERPAERPCWMLTLQTPDGREADWVLTRCQSGAPCLEYLTQGAYPEADDRELDGSELHGFLAVRMLGSVGYDTESDRGYIFHVLPYDGDNPYIRLGMNRLRAITRALEPFGMDGESFVWNEWYADEGTVWTIAESAMAGDTCVLEAGVVHEYYMGELSGEGFVEGQGSPRLSVAEKIAGQARLFERERLLGYAGQTAAEGETLRFDLHGLLVYNPTLAAKTVSVTVNGQAAGTFALTEGDFFTRLPLDFPNEPGDRAMRVELRVTETLLGAPEQAILDLWPDLTSIFRGGR